jgi:hypothetical protein
MKRDIFLGVLQQHPDMALSISEALCEEIRKGSRKYATPMLELTQPQDVNLPAVSIAAGIESYYRSALNALLNARLTGVKAEFFPNMHVQVPTRISYICGFKVLRARLDEHVEQADNYAMPNAIRWGAAIAPGVIMTPISSILEASNAGHMNSESMRTRWMRGVMPRGGREIVFGLGLNQMSDYFEERVQQWTGGDGMVANALGSLIAGVVSGYLSHVPHNLSTFKLLEPHVPTLLIFMVFTRLVSSRLVSSRREPRRKMYERRTISWNILGEKLFYLNEYFNYSQTNIICLDS